MNSNRNNQNTHLLEELKETQKELKKAMEKLKDLFEKLSHPMSNEKIKKLEEKLRETEKQISESRNKLFEKIGEYARKTNQQIPQIIENLKLEEEKKHLLRMAEEKFEESEAKLNEAEKSKEAAKKARDDSNERLSIAKNAYNALKKQKKDRSTDELISLETLVRAVDESHLKYSKKFFEEQSTLSPEKQSRDGRFVFKRLTNKLLETKDEVIREDSQRTPKLSLFNKKKRYEPTDKTKMIALLVLQMAEKLAHEKGQELKQEDHRYDEAKRDYDRYTAVLNDTKKDLKNAKEKTDKTIGAFLQHEIFATKVPQAMPAKSANSPIRISANLLKTKPAEQAISPSSESNEKGAQSLPTPIDKAEAKKRIEDFDLAGEVSKRLVHKGLAKGRQKLETPSLPRALSNNSRPPRDL